MEATQKAPEQAVDKGMTRREVLAAGVKWGGRALLVAILAGGASNASAESTVRTEVNKKPFQTMLANAEQKISEAQRMNLETREKWRKKLEAKGASPDQIEDFLGKHFPLLK